MLTLRIATRESRLALWQAAHVKSCLESAHTGCVVELIGMTTRGDQILDRSLSEIGGKGLFTKELEHALLEHRAELAVHSLKDVPMDLAPEFAMSAVMLREDPRDAFVSNRYASLAELPEGAVVGTSSLRRGAQLAASFPHLRIVGLRGNLDTRLGKLDQGDYAAIVLAAAGLRRLGLAERIRAVIQPDDMLPSPGQGALAIETLAGANAVQSALQALVDMPSWLAVEAERSVSRLLGGNCKVPLAAFCEATGAKLADGSVQYRLRALVANGLHSPVQVLKANATAGLSTIAQARELGRTVVAQLEAQGARELLRIYS
jgi:hydroxymethylbilane synthase